MDSGVYAIVCNGNGKVYVGGSKNTKKRIDIHIGLLNKMKHTNRHLQSAWNIYGKENFIFDVIEYCNTEEIKAKETFWIKELKSCNIENGFNIGIPTPLKLDKANYASMNRWRFGEIEITTIKDFAKYTGVTRKTVYNWIECGGLPTIKNKKVDGVEYLVLGEALKWVIKNKYK